MKAIAPAIPAPIAAEGMDAAPGCSVGCGLPVSAPLLDGVGLLMLVTAVPLLPMPDAPVPEGTTTTLVETSVMVASAEVETSVTVTSSVEEDEGEDEGEGEEVSAGVVCAGVCTG